MFNVNVTTKKINDDMFGLNLLTIYSEYDINRYAIYGIVIITF